MAAAIERERISLLADADALDLTLQLEQIQRGADGAAGLAGWNADIHRRR